MVRTSLSGFCTRFSLDADVALSATGEPLLEEDEQVKCSAGSVSVTLWNNMDTGAGSLYITTKRVIWIDPSQLHLTMALRYQQIVMHAISRDSSTFPRPCIYLQLEDGSEDMMQEGQDDEEDVADQTIETGISGADAEIRFIPEDPTKEEGEGDFFFDEDEVLGGMDAEARAAYLARQAADMELEEGAGELGDLIGEDPGRFEDEYEEVEEGDDTIEQGNGDIH
ncbi:hypothetical protein CEUSTIGMA_g12615.t1 [Chlamydomonas eustigma]|uniref:Methylosome subunit pICln n=1 Tax=Chlamydomonas eustigma TaxID=1157962 RepID=A0A250XQ75_9CHLO|nr:hypothetical protein CEUSTIGMA_g12615.t1 [Chlamydomonas eustigma]|eukprot:GAX85196.1 hypothetical protein CEUSTIGMA_g12615.t1 [Chlamydomonas eustigma]